MFLAGKGPLYVLNHYCDEILEDNCCEGSVND